MPAGPDGDDTTGMAGAVAAGVAGGDGVEVGGTCTISRGAPLPSTVTQPLEGQLPLSWQTVTWFVAPGSKGTSASLHEALPGLGQGNEHDVLEKITPGAGPASLLAAIELEPTMRPQKRTICENRVVGDVTESTTGRSPRQEVGVGVSVTTGVGVNVDVFVCAYAGCAAHGSRTPTRTETH